MRLKRVRIQGYRSIIDSGTFEVDGKKTILVGPNEAGKTAPLEAIQQLNPPEGTRELNALRDYPRAEYHKVADGSIDAGDVEVVWAEFELTDEERRSHVPGWSGEETNYTLGITLKNTYEHAFLNGPEITVFGDIRNDLQRLALAGDKAHGGNSESDPESSLSGALKELTGGTPNDAAIEGELKAELESWLDGVLQYIDEGDERENERYARLYSALSLEDRISKGLESLHELVPVFVLFSSYFRVRPTIHLGQLAQRMAAGTLDDERYDYGNVCLLKLLGFEAESLSKMGRVADPEDDQESMEKYRNVLDDRQYQLNAAEVRLSGEIQKVWQPDAARGETAKLRLRADGQYLKVSVEDDLGVEVELDQRSEGFQWLFSFFVVFFAEAQGRYENAVLLLDESGLSLHGLKQRTFRETISRLSISNQTLYTTHSPFLVGPEELDLVRVVEMTDRQFGTKVHTSITANDSAALLPLQEALGYDLAQSLFTHKRNCVLEGLTDYWYVEGVSALLRDGDLAKLHERIALVPAGSASKVVYFATILHAQGLRVAALLDSDNAGDQAASQDALVNAVGNNGVLRTKDFIDRPVEKAEIEDMLRDTLVRVAKESLGWDVSKVAMEQPKRSIVRIFKSEISGFSKYRLAKAFLGWARENDASRLSEEERRDWTKLVQGINSRLRG